MEQSSGHRAAAVHLQEGAGPHAIPDSATPHQQACLSSHASLKPMELPLSMEQHTMEDVATLVSS